MKWKYTEESLMVLNLIHHETLYLSTTQLELFIRTQLEAILILKVPTMHLKKKLITHF